MFPHFRLSDSQTYFVLALVTAAVAGLHGVGLDHTDVSPHDNPGGRLLHPLYRKAAV